MLSLFGLSLHSWDYGIGNKSQFRTAGDRPVNGKPDMRSTVRGNNLNQNHQFIKTTEKLVGITKAICGHMFDNTTFGKSN